MKEQRLLDQILMKVPFSAGKCSKAFSDGFEGENGIMSKREPAKAPL